MSLYSGVTGKISIKIGSDTEKDIAHMANWNVELSSEMIEVSSFGKDYKEKIPSIKDWTASFDGKVDFAADSGQEDLVDAFEAGTEVEASFYLDTTTFLKGKAFIESLSFSDAADGAADISISLTGNGATTLTLPA